MCIRDRCTAHSRLPDCSHSAAGRAHPAKPQVEGNHLRFCAACSTGLARDTGTRSEAGKLTFAPGGILMADTAFFSPEVFVFLRQLKRHNDREWFAKNKARYQTSIVEPALSFISGFAPYLGRISPHFVADARPTRGSLFRIYRDTRFSPDGRPFKTHVGIHFSHTSGTDAHAPVFYLHLELVRARLSGSAARFGITIRLFQFVEAHYCGSGAGTFDFTSVLW